MAVTLYDPREETDRLKAIPIADILRSLYGELDCAPAGKAKTWRTSDGKVLVGPSARHPGMEAFQALSGPHADGRGHIGALDFVIAWGLARDFQSAKEYLRQFEPSVTLAQQPTKPKTDVEETKPYHEHPVPRVLDPTKNRVLLREYLCGERRLPEEVLIQLADQKPPVLYAGYGTKGYAARYGHYLVFPQYHPDRPEIPTGAILRWRHPGQKPPADWYGGKTNPIAPRSQRGDGWWQVGPYPASTLIVTEAPIDALSLWAALSESDRARTRIVATGGAGGLHVPGMWKGAERVFAAQDRDQEGARQAKQVLDALKAAGLSAGMFGRLTPPAGKDWNAAWQASPEAVRRAVHDSLHPERDRGRSR